MDRMNPHPTTSSHDLNDQIGKHEVEIKSVPPTYMTTYEEDFKSPPLDMYEVHHLRGGMTNFESGDSSLADAYSQKSKAAHHHPRAPHSNLNSVSYDDIDLEHEHEHEKRKGQGNKPATKAKTWKRLFDILQTCSERYGYDESYVESAGPELLASRLSEPIEETYRHLQRRLQREGNNPDVPAELKLLWQEFITDVDAIKEM